MAKGMLKPLFTIKYAQTILTIVITDPAERSIPAINITNVIPIAAIPYMETWRAIVNKFDDERNLGLARDNPINRSRKTIQIALSLN
jgi:hypothetical protein